MAKCLAGAGLLALKKPKGGVHPIAIGEVLRRLVGKTLCANVKEQAQEFFKPNQVGVACPLGADAAIHACRAWTKANKDNPDNCLLKLDLIALTGARLSSK